MMKFSIHVVTCLIIYADVKRAAECLKSISSNISRPDFEQEDARLDFYQLVNKYGHGASLKQYDVVTEDGYILTVFRIPGPKPPVLLFHGLTASSETFIIRGWASMISVLAATGYDVWVGNNRGNLHGRRHVTLDPDTDKSFWDFSLHEIGYYDLPATIDFVRRKTKHDKISTIGHSQGTTAHFVLASLRPEYNERINIFIALAPVAFMNNMSFAVNAVVDAWPVVSKALRLLGIVELLRDHAASTDLVRELCGKRLIGYKICGIDVLLPLVGLDPKGIEPDLLPVVFGHYPSGVSRKCLDHYTQIIMRRKFAQYDYGLDNISKYGRLTPPDYDLEKVTLKTALFAGRNDKLGTVENVARLRNILPNVVHYQVMEQPLWGHMDFIVSKFMTTYLYPPVLDLLERYN